MRILNLDKYCWLLLSLHWFCFLFAESFLPSSVTFSPPRFQHKGTCVSLCVGQKPQSQYQTKPKMTFISVERKIIFAFEGYLYSTKNPSALQSPLPNGQCSFFTGVIFVSWCTNVWRSPIYFAFWCACVGDCRTCVQMSNYFFLSCSCPRAVPYLSLWLLIQLKRITE